MDPYVPARYFDVSECPRVDEHIDGEDGDHGLMPFYPNGDASGIRGNAHPTWVTYCPDTGDPIFLALDAEGTEVVLKAD